jgi:hypothetical protein
VGLVYTRARFGLGEWRAYKLFIRHMGGTTELELELIQAHMAQKRILRVEVGTRFKESGDLFGGSGGSPGAS